MFDRSFSREGYRTGIVVLRRRWGAHRYEFLARIFPLAVVGIRHLLRLYVWNTLVVPLLSSNGKGGKEHTRSVSCKTRLIIFLRYIRLFGAVF